MPITVKVPSSLRNPNLVKESANALRAALERVPGGVANVGREDRLVRSTVALSAAGIGGFAMVASGQVSVVSVMFMALGAYLAVTAITGRDPMYTHYGIDTHAGSGFLAEDEGLGQSAGSLAGLHVRSSGTDEGPRVAHLEDILKAPERRRATAQPVVAVADTAVEAEPVGAAASAA